MEAALLQLSQLIARALIARDGNQFIGREDDAHTLSPKRNMVH